MNQHAEENNDKQNDFAVQAVDLTKEYGNRIAVNAINFLIKKGELFSLLGPNGAGKTTTIKMLSGLVEPTAGTATIMNYDIKRNPTEVKQIINVSPQETAIAGHLSAQENLFLMGGVYGLSKGETKKRTEELVEIFGLAGRANEQVRKFSGGMQRRLSIAMALISDPQVLFLDEPTLGLDPQSRKDLWTQIEKLKGEKTIILTTHYLEEADALADQVGIIKNGTLVAQGSPSELKRDTYGAQKMVVRANIKDEIIEELKKTYPQTLRTEDGIEINAKELVFDDIVDYLRGQGVKIKWLSMKEPSLDDVFLTLTGEEK